MLITTAREFIYVVISLLVVLSNSTEIVLILHTRNRSIFDRLLLSLAFSDCIVGAVVGLSHICLKYFGSFYWLQAEQIGNIFLLSIIFSFTNLLAITIDRFLAVQYPIKHRTLSTPKRANICIAGLWLFSLISILLHGLITFKWAVAINFMHTAASISLLLFGAIIAVLYCGIFCLICKRKMRVARKDGRENNAQRGYITCFLKGPYKVERSVFVTGCIVTISFIVCTYPFAIEFLITQCEENMTLVSQLLVIVNSLLNPFVYFFRRFKR